MSDETVDPIQDPSSMATLATAVDQNGESWFRPTLTPIEPPKSIVVSANGLFEKIVYLKKEDVQLVRKAFAFGDEAHLGQYRNSGEPYITHPLAVSMICADLHLDVHTIIAALLHDVVEDVGVPLTEIAQNFGPQVANLVDGLTKLDRIPMWTKEEVKAESFRKMTLATAQDIRVILIKLADRLHNMRTLGHMEMRKRRRISIETMDIYAPIAHRLGLNQIYRELMELSFAHRYPLREKVLRAALQQKRGDWHDHMGCTLKEVETTLRQYQLSVQIDGREKPLFSIYRKMRTKNLRLSEVSDIYGIRVLVSDRLTCYQTLGILHQLYKPLPGRFKDYIAIPKVNGYQSLHTTVVNKSGIPVEFQIRTHEMHYMAESGVASHWRYKDDDNQLNRAQLQAHQWLQTLLDIQSRVGDSTEFLEHVKIDLFPDAVYVFTPKGDIRALPRGSTALDFAYNVHSRLGHESVAVKINGQLGMLRSELKNGDRVEIITVPNSRPNIAWLGFVKTAKARSAIRHELKQHRFEELVRVGRRHLRYALSSSAITIEQFEEIDVHTVLSSWPPAKSRDDLYVDIALGRQLPVILARKIAERWPTVFKEVGEIRSSTREETSVAPADDSLVDQIVVSGVPQDKIHYCSCCYPVHGDPVVGFLGKEDALWIHRQECRQLAQIIRKDLTMAHRKTVDVIWSAQSDGDLVAELVIWLKNEKGAIAKVASAINLSDANITFMGMIDTPEPDADVTPIRLRIAVRDRLHLSKVFRQVRRVKSVERLVRGGDVCVLESK